MLKQHDTATEETPERCAQCLGTNLTIRDDEDPETGYREEVVWCRDCGERAD